MKLIDKDMHSPCPFCGGTDFQVDIFIGRDPWAVIMCENCDAVGPSAENEEEAWKRWDNRVA